MERRRQRRRRGFQWDPTCASSFSPVSRSFQVRVRIRQRQLLPPHEIYLPTVSSLHFQQSLLFQVARSPWSEERREVAGSSSVQSQSDPFFRACVWLPVAAAAAGERAREREPSLAAVAEGPAVAASWFWRRVGREEDDGILLAAVRSLGGWLVGRASSDFVCSLSPSILRLSARPSASQPTGLRTPARTP